MLGDIDMGLRPSFVATPGQCIVSKIASQNRQKETLDFIIVEYIRIVH